MSSRVTCVLWCCFCLLGFVVSANASDLEKASPVGWIVKLGEACRDIESRACDAAVAQSLTTTKAGDYALRALEACDLGNHYGCRTWQLNSHFRQITYWKKRGYPVDGGSLRIEALPKDLLKFIHAMALGVGKKTAPSSSVLSPKLRERIRAQQERLDKLYFQKFHARPIAIFVGKNLGSSAIFVDLYGDSEKANGAKGLPKAYFLILDTELLNKAANAWASFKENAAFNRGYEVELRLESDQNDDLNQTLAYPLLHENAHGVGRLNGNIANEFTPEGEFDSQHFPYFKVNGTKDDWVRLDSGFPERKKLMLYRDKSAEMSPEKIATIYKNSRAFGYPTLTSAANIDEDFADSFASYVHVVLEKRPYQLTVRDKGKLIFSASPCWAENSCAKRRSYFDALFSTPGKN